MRTTYRVLAWAIPVLVAIQAAAIAFTSFGLFVWVEDGNDLTAAALESETDAPSWALGAAVHAMNGIMLVPLVAVVLLIVSFFAKVRRGVLLAALILADVILQIVLGFAGFAAPLVGAFHGINALVLATLGIIAARSAARPGPARPTVDEPPTLSAQRV